MDGLIRLARELKTNQYLFAKNGPIGARGKVVRCRN